MVWLIEFRYLLRFLVVLVLVFLLLLRLDYGDLDLRRLLSSLLP